MTRPSSGRGVSPAVKTPRSSSTPDPLIRGSKQETIGVIGLGTMGSAMAANLLKAGCRVHGFDVVAARREELKKADGAPATSVAALAQLAQALITSPPTAQALHDVANELAGKGRGGIEACTPPVETK